MPRFSIELRDGITCLRDEDRRSAIVAGPYTQLYSDADAIELRDLLLHEFPIDTREAN